MRRQAQSYFGSFCCFRQSILRIMLILLAVQQLENSLMLCHKFVLSKKWGVFFRKTSVSIKLSQGRISPGLTEIL